MRLTDTDSLPEDDLDQQKVDLNEDKSGAAGRYITQFDSTTSMLYSLARCLQGKSFPGVGVVPHVSDLIPGLINSFPAPLRTAIYRWSGWFCAPKEKTGSEINAEDISKWVTSQYPDRRYPAVMIGSSNGALTHVCAALGIPWLPQTFLLTFRRDMHADEMAKDVEWGKRMAKILRANNPELGLYQMHDPVQDRIMVEKIGYFRIKRLRAGAAYENFLTKKLPEGGTIILNECRHSWPAARVGARHTFQIGGLGDMSGDEYLDGSPRVERFLRKNGSLIKRWEAPGEKVRIPEAEWGFDPELREDIERIALKYGYKIRQIVYDDPEDPSIFVSDLYRSWYAGQGVKSSRLLVENFALLEPWWAINSWSIPLWLTFNTMPSLKTLQNYLNSSGPFDEIFLMLMSNAIRSIGQVPIEKWDEALRLARVKGDYVGVEAKKYPVDLAAFVRYHTDLKKKIPVSKKAPEPLTLAELEKFFLANDGRSPVEWAEL